MKFSPSTVALAVALAFSSPLSYSVSQSADAQSVREAAPAPTPWVVAATAQAEKQTIAFRHHIHQHPELGNQEVKTAAFVAKHLKALGLEVHTGIAGTGVVAVLKGGLPGPTVGLRADMDAVPGKETAGLAFASQAKGIFQGKEVDVMHACGHDAHTAMLMGAATVMVANKDKIPGNVVFVFQPAEEGPSDIDVFAKEKKSWGAKRMVEEGIIDRFKIQAMFGVHVMSSAHTGEITYKAGPALNSADGFRIQMSGKQTHGSMPWAGTDPIVAAAHTITGMQTIVSRQANLLQGMGVVSVGSIHAGNAGNIIPGELTMEGTIRSNSPDIRNSMLKELPALVKNTATTHHVHAEVNIAQMMPVTINNEELTHAMVPALQRASNGKAKELKTGQSASEDFAYYAEKVPGLFVFLGATPPGKDLSKVAANHHPAFFVDDATLATGVRSHVEFVLGYADWTKTKNR